MTPLETALDYISRGWNPLPVPHGSKRPIGDAWQSRIIDATSAPRHFNGGLQNIGVILGPSSRGLTDIDLDAPEAIMVAPYLLPRTKAIFGRGSKRASHYLYYTDLSVTQDAAAIQLKTPEQGMLVEVRIGGNKGAQTIFPGSTHESGEAIVWEENGEPANVSGDTLVILAKHVAAACLIARHWPAKGDRHHAARVLGGLLARAGFQDTRIKVFAEAVARAAGDTAEWRDRVKAAEDAAKNYHSGGRTYGLPQLIELMDEKAAKRVADWLNYDDHDAHQDDDDDIRRTLRSVVQASTVSLQAVDWLWPNRFAIGKLGLLVGLPDEGKGQLLCDIAARVSSGEQWPCAEGIAPHGNVIMLTAEDDIADTVVPRLVAAGADLERIYFINMVCDRGKDRMFSLVTDLQLLRQKIAEIGDVVLIQIDPISAYLGVGKVDSFRTSDVRAVLAPLVDLAADCKAAIVGVMHFNKKTDVTNVLLRISDSLAFGATARHVYGVINDAEHKRKLVVRAKNNLASAEMDKALGFRFGLRQVGVDPQNNKEIWAPHVLWESQHVDITALEAMQAAADNRSPSARDAAKKFLAELLANGPITTADIKDAAEGNGIGWRTVERAKAELAVIAKKTGFGGGWTWQLPDQPKPRQWTD
jgi:hypothetical protein